MLYENVNERPIKHSRCGEAKVQTQVLLLWLQIALKPPKDLLQFILPIMCKWLFTRAKNEVQYGGNADNSPIARVHAKK